MEHEMTTTQGMSLEDFIRRYEEDGPFEFIDGEVIALSPVVMSNSTIIANLMWLLQSHIRPNRLGMVYAETPFVLVHSSNWTKGSRVPDIMMVTQERFDAYCAADPDWERKPLVLVPDLVVEVISPTDKYSDVNAKVALYLEDGVRLVLVIDPQQKTLVVARHGSSTRTNLTTADTFTADDVIPGLEIAVTAIFA
ncbi:MAG: Uma2 family endonuclease [Anaerolineae bacterium]